MLGIPVVATRAGGGVRDIVPPTGAGRLVSDGDAVAMASAIGEFLDSPDSRRLAAQTGAALRTRFAPSTVAGAFESIYRTALNRRG